jgi:hypothetical protein
MDVRTLASIALAVAGGIIIAVVLLASIAGIIEDWRDNNPPRSRDQ